MGFGVSDRGASTYRITGNSVTINGSSLGGTSSVKFGALSATFSVVSTTQVTANVPNGATSAKISLTTPGGTATSGSTFTVLLSIVSFSPASGPAGTTVTINGVGSNTSSSVAFNGASAATTFISSTQLTAIVPATATTGPLSVTNTTAPAGSVHSAGTYNP